MSKSTWPGPVPPTRATPPRRRGPSDYFSGFLLGVFMGSMFELFIIALVLL
jgi:hypothetical protein